MACARSPVRKKNLSWGAVYRRKGNPIGNSLAMVPIANHPVRVRPCERIVFDIHSSFVPRGQYTSTSNHLLR